MELDLIVAISLGSVAGVLLMIGCIVCIVRAVKQKNNVNGQHVNYKGKGMLTEDRHQPPYGTMDPSRDATLEDSINGNHGDYNNAPRPTDFPGMTPSMITRPNDIHPHVSNGMVLPNPVPITQGPIQPAVWNASTLTRPGPTSPGTGYTTGYTQQLPNYAIGPTTTIDRNGFASYSDVPSEERVLLNAPLTTSAGSQVPNIDGPIIPEKAVLLYPGMYPSSSTLPHRTQPGLTHQPTLTLPHPTKPESQHIQQNYVRSGGPGSLLISGKALQEQHVHSQHDEDSQQPPVQSSQPPTDSTQAPDGSSHPPSDSMQTPADPTQAPGDSSQPLVDSTQAQLIRQGFTVYPAASATNTL